MGESPEELLRASEARKSAVIQGALDCIITMDHQGLVTEFNPAAERTFGYARSEAIGRPLADLIIPPSLRRAHREGLKRYLATGEGPVIGKRIELIGMRANGTEFPVELIVTRMAQEEPAMFTGFIRDLSDQKRIEEALVRSERRFRRLAEAGIIGIITADVHGNVLEANDAFLEMVGYDHHDVASGRVRWSDMTPSEWRSFDERAIEQLFTTGFAAPWEKEYFRKDGSRIPILVGVAMLDASLGHCVAFILDLTERKEAQAAIEKLQREREADLQASIQIRDDFLAVAGHELKTPLAALLMQIQGLLRAARSHRTLDLEARLDKAAEGGLRLERLINQLLDVSRITAGRLSLELEPVDLVALVREVVSRIFEPGGRPNGNIVVRCEGSLIGLWDRLRIDQVITNLLENAFKYGEGKPIEVELRLEKGDAVLRVVDHGIGIDLNHQRKIFDKFERAVAVRDIGGIGLGLWITRQIVEASGGQIAVRSAPGQGSTFTVRLPIRSVSSEVSHGNA
jgi:PAS domain S-box-containing protein